MGSNLWIHLGDGSNMDRSCKAFAGRHAPAPFHQDQRRLLETDDGKYCLFCLSFELGEISSAFSGLRWHTHGPTNPWGARERVRRLFSSCATASAGMSFINSN